MFKQAIKCAAKRLFPTFVNIDATYNLQYYQPGNYRTEIATMGCRTRTISNINGEQTCVGRGNFAFVTINLPKLAIEANKDISTFFNLLDKYMEISKDYLIERYDIIKKKHVYNFPFILGNKIYMGSEHLKRDDTIEEALKHSTMSIGFCGLAECLVALIGKHHGESAEAQRLGLTIVSHMRAITDRYIQMTHMNWSLFGTPAESTAGKFAKICQKQYGIIPGVTDRDFQTNSSHVPVYYPIKAIDKIKIEAPYHELENAGHILYIEFEGDATKNLEAFESVIRAMHDNNAGYFAINTKSADYCPACGNASFIDKACPICGYDEHVENQHYKVRLKEPE